MRFGNKQQVSSKTLGNLALGPNLLDLIPIPLALWDGARTDCVINPSASQLTGFSQAESQANPQLWVQQVHCADFNLFRDFLKRAAAAPGESACDYRFVPKNRSEAIWLRETSIPLSASSGRWQTLSSYIDITDLKTAADQTDQEIAGAPNNTLIRSMFHEIKNRLQRLSMEIELAALESQMQADVSHKFIDALQAVNQSLTVMHDHLLSAKSSLSADRQ